MPCNTRTEEASNLHAQGSCPGASNNGAGRGIGFHTVIPFSVRATSWMSTCAISLANREKHRHQNACADVFHFRFHADYGRGGYIGVNDGSAGTFNDASLNRGLTADGRYTSGDVWGNVEIQE